MWCEIRVVGRSRERYLQTSFGSLKSLNKNLDICFFRHCGRSQDFIFPFSFFFFLFLIVNALEFIPSKIFQEACIMLIQWRVSFSTCQYNTQYIGISGTSVFPVYISAYLQCQVFLYFFICSKIKTECLCAQTYILARLFRRILYICLYRQIALSRVLIWSESLSTQKAN